MFCGRSLVSRGGVSDAQKWRHGAFIAHRFQYGLLSLSKHQQHGRFNEEIWCPNGNLLLKGKAGSKLYTLKSITVVSVFSFNLFPLSTQRSNSAHPRRRFLTRDLNLWSRKQIALNTGQNAYCDKQKHCFNLTQVCLLIDAVTTFLIYKLGFKMEWVVQVLKYLIF